jgi:hypothetical protein
VRTRLICAALAVATVSAAPACSDGSGGAFATPSTMPTAAATSPAVDPASFPETQAGATSFVRAFFEAYRATFTSGETKPARAFIDPSCGCFPVLDDIDDARAQGERYVGVSADFGGLNVNIGGGQALVIYYTSGTGGSVVAADGSPVATVKPDSPAPLEMRLMWRGRWWITEVAPA